MQSDSCGASAPHCHQAANRCHDDQSGGPTPRHNIPAGSHSPEDLAGYEASDQAQPGSGNEPAPDKAMSVVTVRMPPSVRARLSEAAHEARVSMNAFAAAAIVQACEKSEARLAERRAVPSSVHRPEAA
jgi:hypothetical protein